MELEALKKFMGERILELREKNKYSKKDVRAKTDISEQMQKQYEKGDVKKLPAIDVLLKLSELYQVPISYFFPDIYNTPVKSNKYQISSIYEVAKTIVDLSLAQGVQFYIEEIPLTTYAMCENLIHGPERDVQNLVMVITDKSEAYDLIRNTDNPNDDIFTEYENSILYQFFESIKKYYDLHNDGTLNDDEYKSLCEKALKMVKEREAKEKSTGNNWDKA